MNEEQKKNASVTAYFYGTGIEVKGFVDPSHGVYKVTLDGKELEYQDGQGNASLVDGKKYFSGTATTRQGDQTLVRLTGLEEGWHAVTLQLDPKRMIPLEILVFKLISSSLVEQKALFIPKKN